MTKIKITSNPYEQTIEYHHWNDAQETWEDVRVVNHNTSLRYDGSSRKIFLPFKIKEIIDTIIDEFHNGTDKIEIIFDGTDDEYKELYNVCQRDDIAGKIICGARTRELSDASVIIKNIDAVFKEIRPIIDKTVQGNDRGVISDLKKIDEALDNVVPICVFGNYSTGKSTFINSMIGHEVLPKAGEPVTAKIYKIIRASDDTAQIAFEYLGESYKMIFRGEEHSLINGDPQSLIAQSIQSKIGTAADMYASMSRALEAINSHDKDNDSDDIGDVIIINVPFSTKGLLGRSEHNFVIFDTPGANSNTHKDHAEILETALESLSNGIPVWMSIYDNLDSIDNAQLCDKILKIDALDKRFTMIVVNKADDAELDDIDEKKAEIMEYEAVKTMYSNGIYFISAFMGLGAKIDGDFTDKHFSKLYHKNHGSYSDPDDRFYETLYKYNIMPAQIKDEVMKTSGACHDLVYANSGLFCIEEAMENFASRYATYNKCHMVDLFIKIIVDKVKNTISPRVDTLKKKQNELAAMLESEKADLLKQINQEADKMDSEFLDLSKNGADQLAKRKESTYCLTAQTLEQKDNEVRKGIDRQEIEAHMQIIEESKGSIWDNLKQGGQELLHGRFAVFGKKINDLVGKAEQLKDSVEDAGSLKRHEDQIVSEKLMQYVHGEYKESINRLSEELKTQLQRQWLTYIDTFRHTIERLITDSSVLSDEQQQKIADIVANFESPVLNDESNKVFMREKYLKGYFLGLPLDTLGSDIIYYNFPGAEALDKEKLAREYNDELKTCVKDIADKINHTCYVSFTRWQAQLIATIERNIVEFNPKLAKLAADIKQYQDEIGELTRDSETLCSAISTIDSMMSWK